MEVFSKVLPFEFVMEPKGKGNSIERVVKLNGKTLAEHHDNSDLAEKPDELITTNSLSGILIYKSPRKMPDF